MTTVTRSFIVVLSLCAAPVVAFCHDGRNEVGAIERDSALCFVAPAALSEAEIADFLANSRRLLTDNSVGGLALSNRVRSGVGSSRAFLRQVVDLSKAANDAQVAAIGAGLGRAAKSCSAINPPYAAEIQIKVLESDSPKLIAAFVSASEEFESASVAASSRSSPAGAAGIAGNGAIDGGAAGLGGDDATATASGVFGVQRTARFFRQEISPFN